MSKDSVQEFLNHHGVKKNRFYGKCIKLGNGSLLMEDIISKDEGTYLIEDNGNRLKVFATKKESEFSEGEFYEFSIHIVETDEASFPVVDKLSIPPILLEKNPFKEIADQRYGRLDNPESNKIIANLMREIGKGLYSSKKRMVFELLQNADDTPAGEQVEFLVDAYDGYLLIMHNGIPFNKEDVEAITSAAESTKKKDDKKTGYKGIGFKSVFTDSEKVIIKSGAFLFSFDRHYEGFNSFDDFYFNRKRYRKYPELLEEDKKLFRKEREEFQESNHLPWQLLPIWLHNIPKELRGSKFTGQNNVGIAIKFGKRNVENYLNSVKSLTEQPEFMLFLRHVNKFQSLKLGFTIEKEGVKNVKIKHSTRKGEFLIKVFSKKEVLGIQINERALAAEGVHIYKQTKTNEFGETEYYFSSDKEGKARIENIPPKLAAAKETTITFAAPRINNSIQAEERYLEDNAFSSFFTYLPMNEHRIQLPMFVNADFVPSSDRESLQGDNEWNIYVMAKIGTNHALWISEFAQNGAKSDSQIEPQYLSLLLKEPLEELDEVAELVNKYNQNYLNALSSTPFILSDSNEVLKKEAVILDDSYLSNILGNDYFYKISSTELRLPHPRINSNYLKYEYLNVKQFKKTDLIARLKHVENRVFLREAVAGTHEEDYIKVLKWMHSLARHPDLTSEWLNPLPFLRLGDGNILSLEEVHNSEDILLNRSQLREVRSTLNNLGFRFTTYELDSYPNIYDKIPVEKIADKALFESIKKSESLGNLSSSEKATLISFISELNEVGEKKYGQDLSLFTDQSDDKRLKPLSQLISNSESDLPSWLSHMKIDQDEEEALDVRFSTYLLKKKDLLHGLFCVPELYDQVIQNVDHEALNSFYQFLTELSENFEEQPTGRTEIPWIYVPSKESFHKSDAVFLPESLQKLDELTYESVSSVIESITDLMVPDYSSHSLIRELSLGTRSIDFTESINPGAVIGQENIAPFLNWLSDNKENSFFESFIVEDKENSYVLSKSDKNKQYYSSSEKLIKYISERDEGSEYKLLPEGLFFSGLEKAGLLTGEDLFKNIIALNLSDIDLINFFEPHLSDSLLKKYLNSIKRISIETTQMYGADSSIAKIVELASKLVSKGGFDVDLIRSNLYVDGHQLSDTAISDDIYFKGHQYSPILKLSEILPDYQDKTYSYSGIRDIFPDTTNEILKKIFLPKQLTPRKIYNKLSEIDQEILSPEQTLFMVMYAHDQNFSDLFKRKSSFTAYFDNNSSKYKECATSFLNLSVRESGLRQAASRLNFPDLDPELTVLNPEFAIESELPPQWFKAWIDQDGNEQKVEFTKSIGFNYEDSAVVRLRKSVIENNSEVFDTARVELTNKQQLVNTLFWLQKKQKSNDLKLTNAFLQPLYKKADYLNCTLKEIPIPVSKKNGDTDLSLIDFKGEARFYVRLQSWTEHADSIFSFLDTINRFAVPDFLPEKYLRELDVKEVEATLELNKEKVSGQAEYFDAPFYQNWERKEELKILVYPKERLPFNLSFDDKVLKEIDSDNFFFTSNSEVIISRSIKGSIPDILRSDLKEKDLDDLFNSLKVQRDDWEKQSEKNKEGIDYSEDELKVLKRLFDDDLPEDYKKNFNLAALVSGLVKLESLNYDVEEAYENLKNTHEYSQIEPVRKSKETITVMCRSARQGLLYLTAQAWNRLDEPDINLYTDLGNGEYLLHDDKKSVLDSTDSDAEFQILRIESESDLLNIEDILTGHFAADKIWIIFKVKAKTNFDPIFYKSIQPENTTENSPPSNNDSAEIPY